MPKKEIGKYIDKKKHKNDGVKQNRIIDITKNRHQSSCNIITKKRKLTSPF